MDADLHVKSADFGLTRLLEATVTRSGALHLNFAAPELFGSLQDDASDDVPARAQKSDVYAFECLYYEVSSVKRVMPLVNKGFYRSITILYPLRVNKNSRSWDSSLEGHSRRVSMSRL